MKPRRAIPVLLAVIGMTLIGSGAYGIDWGGAAKSTLKATGSSLAGALGEKFGVPAAAVTSLFDQGLNLEGVVQALLISQSAKTPVSKVSDLLKSNKNDVTAAAESLGVSASAYTQDKVNAVIRDVSGTAGDVKGTVDAVQGTTDLFTKPKP